MSDSKNQHKHNDGSSTRAFTPEQKAAVLRVRRCKPTDFYDILGLQDVRTSCSDSDIKKAYRKLSLLTHPDKNGYAGADEAFKMVSRAFQVLSDADKRKQYDQFGGDPDNRFASASASGANPFAGFASQRAGARGGPGAGFRFEEEISPEELFRQFFGGGMGGPFGGMGGGPFGGPGFMFNMGGGPGIRIHQFGGANPRRRPHNHENPADAVPASPLQALQGLLPLILLVLLPILSALFSGSTEGSGPQMRFDAAVPPLTQLHTSNQLKVPYWVNPTDVKDFSARNWRDWDRVAEHRHVQHLQVECEYEQGQRQKLAAEAQGFFWTDMAMLERARRMEMPSCKKLNGYKKRGSSPI